MKLENEAAFSPVEVLSDIEVQRQLVPNRVSKENKENTKYWSLLFAWPVEL